MSFSAKAIELTWRSTRFSHAPASQTQSGSRAQVSEQPSPAASFESSQDSPEAAWMAPSPQRKSWIESLLVLLPGFGSAEPEDRLVTATVALATLSVVVPKVSVKLFDDEAGSASLQLD